MVLNRLPWLVGATLLAGLAGLDVSARTDPPPRYSGLTWRLLGPSTGGPVTGVSGRPGEPGVYRVSAPGGSFETDDGGTTWVAVSGGPVAGTEWTDPLNPQRRARVDPTGISVSLDAGQTWTAHHNLPIATLAHLTAAQPTPASPVYWIFASGSAGETVALPSRPTTAPVPPVPPVRPPAPFRYPPIDGHTVLCERADSAVAGLRFAGTQDGILVSFDGAARWAPLQLNLPPVPVTDLLIHDSDLVVATEGRSAWVLEDISPLRQIAEGEADGPIVLFRPTPVTLDATGHAAGRANIDYYLALTPSEPVLLEILDRTGAPVFSARSDTPPTDDGWTPVRAPIPASAGGHRIAWDGRWDPPPAPSNRFRRLAPALFEGLTSPALVPVGPTVRPGAYQVRLTVGARQVSQPWVVDSSVGAPTDGAGQGVRFDRAREVYDALKQADGEARQLARLRVAVAALAASPNGDVAQAATDFAGRLVDLAGTAWHLALPDADSGNEPEIFDDKEHDLPPLPPAPVSLTKDYDDPTTIIGRTFENLNHAPSFALAGDALTSVLTQIDAEPGGPPPTLAEDMRRGLAQLSEVEAAWQGTLRTDLPAFNQILTAHGLAPIKPPA
jgi:hypothetical protein